MSSAIRRVAVAARLLLKDLLRRRLTLVLLFIVPALFDGVVLATTVSRQIEVTIGSLVEEGAEIKTPETPPDIFDTNLLDNGSRQVDQRQLSLTFLGHAAVCFLACFLAFNLVHKRKDVDARLVLAGYRPREVLLAKLAVLLVLVALLAVYETAVIRPWLVPKHVDRVGLGLLLGGLTYGCLGFLIGALVKQELEGIFLIVLLTNVDVGWLQNPIYFAHSQRRALIEHLPAYGPTQIAVTGALFDDAPMDVFGRSLLYLAVVAALSTLIFGIRIRPARQDLTDQQRTRRYYAKVLVLAYAAWLAALEVVGRYAATLHTVDLTTAWDRAIPLVPGFVWPYEACYVVPLLSLFVIRDWHRFNVAMLAIALANLTAFVLYLFVPVAFPRPDLGTSLSERMLALEYAADFSPGANKLPSMHVAMSWIMGAAMWRQASRRVVDGLIIGLVAAITVAALFVKQHILIDVVSGIAWGLAAFWLAAIVYHTIIDSDAAPEDGLLQLAELRCWRRLVQSEVHT